MNVSGCFFRVSSGSLGEADLSELKRLRWDDALDQRLLREVSEHKISNYPQYIEKSDQNAKWRSLPLHKEEEMPLKSLKDRFYEAISPLLDKSYFREEEDVFLLEAVSKYDGSGTVLWGEISNLFFQRFSGEGGPYRSATYLKNRCHSLKTPRHRGKLLARSRPEAAAAVELSLPSLPKKPRLVEESVGILKENLCSLPLPPPLRRAFSINQDPSLENLWSPGDLLKYGGDFTSLCPSVCSPFVPDMA